MSSCSCSSVLVRGTREERYRITRVSRGVNFEFISTASVLFFGARVGHSRRKIQNRLGLTRRQFCNHINCVCVVVLRCSCGALAKRNTESLGTHEASILNRYQLRVRSCSSVLVQGTREEKYRIAWDIRGVKLEIISIASV